MKHKDCDEIQEETIDALREEKLNELEILRQSLQEEKEKAVKAHDTFLRLAAEFSNYKNRVAKERQELIDFAHKSLLISLLPFLDSFAKALEAQYDTKEGAVKGMQTIHSSLIDILKKEGLTKMDVFEKQFDPHVHEAVGFDERDDIDENKITTELHTGYMLHDKVLRPAMVRISKKTEKKEASNEEKKEASNEEKKEE